MISTSIEMIFFTGSKDKGAAAAAAYDIEDKFFFQRRDFNRFKEVNDPEEVTLHMPPTEGIELHHWKAHEVLLLDTAGMNFLEGIKLLSILIFCRL